MPVSLAGEAAGRLPRGRAGLDELAFLPRGVPLALVLERRADEVPEQRRRPLGTGLELRMELRRHEIRVIAELDDLHQALVGRRAGDDQPGVLEPLAQEVVHLVAVAVALVDHGLAVDLASTGALMELHRVRAK